MPLPQEILITTASLTWFPAPTKLRTALANSEFAIAVPLALPARLQSCWGKAMERLEVQESLLAQILEIVLSAISTLTATLTSSSK